MILTIAMNEENNMDDATPPNTRSESAFSGTSDETELSSPKVAPEIQYSNAVLLAHLTKDPVKATKYGHSFAILIPKRIIPSHSRSDILEVKIARASEPETQVTLYTTHLPGYRHAYLDLQPIDPVHGEAFWVRSVNIYAGPQFVADFDLMKPAGLENTELVWEKDQIAFLVDGEKLKLTGQRFRTYQGQVILDCGLGESGKVKIAKGIEGFRVRLADHSPVVSIAKYHGGIHLTYTRTEHDEYLHRRTVVSRIDDLVEDDAPMSTGLLQLEVMEKPRGGQGIYSLRAGQSALVVIAEALEKAKDDLDSFRDAKGSIAEEIVRQLLNEFGMVLVKDHPLTPLWWSGRSKRPGPDLLVRLAQTGELSYVETKWWGKVSGAKKKATRQVLNTLEKHPKTAYGTVTGAFIAILEWKGDSEVAELYIKRVNGRSR
ncbi:MAG TPA: hypothetical protein VGS11_13645 [Candidatus Bathyarchaeia archaeon]|nr:hypothetical protein [Candidatus Bathyarchaeia archaeon]